MPESSATPNLLTREVTPPEGITTIDDKMVFEPERLSYASAIKVATEIADRVKDHAAGRTVVIAGDAFLSDLGNLGASRLQLEMLTEDFQRVAASLAGSGAAPAELGPALAGPALAAAVPAIAAGLQGALGLAGVLREDVAFHGVTTRIDPRAFEIALAAALHRRSPTTTVFVPDLMVVRSPLDGAGAFRERWRTMQEARHAAWQAAGPLLAELGRTDAALDAAGRDGAADRVEALSRRVFELRRTVEPLTETLTSADRRVTDLQAQWDKPHETTGLTVLARLLRAEALEAEAPLYLHASVVSSGGHNRVTRHLLRFLFLGDGLSSMGGAVVRWALLQTDGRFLNGGVRAARRVAPFPNPIGDGDGWVE